MTRQPIDILLVQDNEIDEELTAYMLRRHKVDNAIRVVRDGPQALDFLMRRGIYALRDSNMPRLVLLDVHLPKLDGIEVLKRIKGNAATQDIPVVLLASSHDDQHISEAYHAGADHHIVKPVTFDQFIEMARRIGLSWLLLTQGPTDTFAMA